MIGKLCRTTLAAALVALVANLAHAAAINFETTPPLMGGGTPTDDTPLPTISPYVFPGLLVTFGFDLDSNGTVESNAVFEHTGTDPGEPPNAGFASWFGGFDNPEAPYGPQLGSWFLRSPNPGAPFGRFVIQYSTALFITSASGEIWDIDGSPTNTEKYHIEAFDSSNALLGFQDSPLGNSTGPFPSLDSKPWMFTFSGLSGSIDHIVITFTGTKMAGLGLAFNNFDPVAVPEPASAPLALAACAAMGLVVVRRRRGALLTAVVIASLLGVSHAGTASAAVISYDNLDPTPTPYLYANYGTWTGNFLPNLYATSGTSFVPNVTGPLDELSLGMILGHTYGTPAVALKLSNDVAGNPGPTIFSVNASAPNAAFGTLMTLTGLGGPTITAGQTYWLLAECPVDGVTMQNWFANNQGLNGPIISGGTRYASSNLWSLRVGVLKVPEPTGGILAAAGLAAVAMLRRRTRRPAAA